MIEHLPRLAVIAISCASALTPIFAAETSPQTSLISLHEGGDFSVSLPADHSQLAFDLVGGIWVMAPEDGNAEAITAITEFNRHPAFSPDGQWIAYESVRDGFHQIMLIDKDGGTPIQATFGNYHHLSPAWSPDGLALVFASNRADNFDLWKLDLETSELHQLTFDRRNEFEPNWNEDGTRLAFVRDDGTDSSILTLQPGAKPTVLLTEKTRLHGPSWRPGNQVLTYVRQHNGRSQLRMLLLSQPAITKPITHGEYAHPFPVHWVDRKSFIYAADGLIKRRIFGEPHAEQMPFNAQIEVTRDTWSVRKQDFNDFDNRPVTGITGISPTGDGRLIVSALSDIWELDADGTLLRQLTNDAFVDTHPAVSPNGRTLAYVSDRSGSLQVWLMDIETKKARRVTSESGMALFPVWTPASDHLSFLVANHPAATKLTLKQIRLSDLEIEVLATDLPRSTPPILNRDDWSVPLNRPTKNDLREKDSVENEFRVPEVPLSWRPFKPNDQLIVRASRIFDGIGPDYLIDHEVVIEDNRITDVRPWTDYSETARIIDAKDHTIIPGLIDLSAQQTYVGGERSGRTWLAFGVTSIRETVTDLPEATERYESWRSGRRIGPRLFMALNPCARISRPAELSLLDIIIEGEAHPNITQIELCPSLNSSGLRQMIATAHSFSLPTVSVTPFPVLFLGADEVQLTASDGQIVSTLSRNIGANLNANFNDVVTIAGKLNTILISNLASTGLAGLSTQSALTDHPRYKKLFTSAERSWYRNLWNQQMLAMPDGAETNHRSTGQILFRAITQGARVATGSRAPMTPYGLGLQAELRLLGETGLRPFQILKMASLDAARIMGAGDDLGSIHAGKLADLVIIDGDPLANIGDTANVVMTIINGRPYGAEELLTPGGRAGSVEKFYTFKPAR